jgi:hypothetical protein
MLRESIPIATLGAGLAWALLGVSAVAASPLDLVEILKDNTVSGHTASGVPYNLYFLEGGRVTYADAAGQRDSGVWRIGEKGEVCLRWQGVGTPGEGCSSVNIEGHDMTWADGDGESRSVLRGTVTSDYLEKRR